MSIINHWLRCALGKLSPVRFPMAPLEDKKGETMTAVVMKQHGDVNVLNLTEGVPRPMPNPGTRQILVKVVAASINPVDFKLRKGPILDFILPKPKILGSDFAGVVVSAPQDSLYKQGQRVFGMLPILGSRYGSLAPYCVVDEESLALAPDNVSLTCMASVPLVACTVIQAMAPVVAAFEGDVRGKKCFISGGSGGVGTYAVQYCSRVLGMSVTTSCSSRNFDLMRSLGAERVFDYKTRDIEDEVRDFDVFIDPFGYINEEKVYKTGSRILRSSGEYASHYVRIASSPNGGEHALSEDPFHLSIPESRLDRVVQAEVYSMLAKKICYIQYHYVLVVPNLRSLANTAWNMENGKIRAVVHQTFPLDQVREAFKMLEEGHVTGKLVIVVDKESAEEEDRSIARQHQ